MPASQDPVSVAARAVEMALKVGADAADACTLYASNLGLSVRGGQIDTLNRAVSRGLSLRVTLDRRTAMAHTTDLSAYSLARLATTALEMARVLPESQEPVYYGAAQAIEALPHPDPDLQSETIEAKARRLSEIEKAMLAVPGMTRSYSVSWSQRDGEMGLVNSRGLSLYAPVCRVEVGVEGIAERDGESFTGGYSAAVPTRRALPDPAEMGRRAGARAVELLGARAVPSTKAPVIFAPQTGWALLACLSEALRGDNVVERRSYLADRKGQVIAAPAVTIRDNPLLTRGVARGTFDAEGSPTRDLALVQNGRLQSYLCDLAAGAQLGVPGGGNAVRGSYDSRIEIGTSNLYLEAGGDTPEAIVQATSRGLLVTSLSGWWVGRSSVEDTFSSAAMGLWIENGQPAYPVRGVTIGGTLLAMLSGVDRIGNDLEFLHENSTPTFRVAEMAISGT
jgi:PmbA protein